MWCWWPRESILQGSSTLSEFCTSLSKVLTLWNCVKVKQRCHQNSRPCASSCSRQEQGYYLTFLKLVGYLVQPRPQSSGGLSQKQQRRILQASHNANAKNSKHIGRNIWCLIQQNTSTILCFLCIVLFEKKLILPRYLFWVFMHQVRYKAKVCFSIIKTL